METTFTVDKAYPHIKASVDKGTELYIFKCDHCRKRLELGFNFAKYNDMKETGKKFVFEHRFCKKVEEVRTPSEEMKMGRNGTYRNE